MEVFFRLNAQGRTVIIVTREHDIAAYAHRIIQVKDGLVAGDETGEEVEKCSGKASLLPSRG
ncbi:hypothetical protein [Anaeroselena agilis]|uniref:Uncharacterized protein n=1 Tax=Anaeroselena agilis TaxID=3063788 RepID=A0ABU3P0J5_9FIRM|nr:hypothetical protein [Selenomonadales bacterium 4137-cl]